MKKKMQYVLIVGIIFSFTGCMTIRRQYQAETRVVINVDSDQYDIVGDIEGEAVLKVIIPIIPIPIIIGNTNTMKYGTVEYAGTKYRFRNIAIDMAIFNAMENAEAQYPGGVDAIITPKSTITTSGFPPFYIVTNVKVKGKGIRFKTSE